MLNAVVCRAAGTRTQCSVCVLVLLWGLSGLVEGYGRGSPQSSCRNLEPQHFGTKPQTSPSPYSINVVDATSDGKAKVRISGVDIMGFVVQARDDNDTVVGTFTDLAPLTTTITCREKADTWSHSDTSLKADLLAQWEPSSHFIGSVQFRGSVLRDEKTYWVNLAAKHVVESATGDPVTDTASDPATDTATDTATDKATDTIDDKSQQDIDSDVATPDQTSRSNEL